MTSKEVNLTKREYELKDELARLCLPGAERRSDRRLAWVNSICILFLLVGIFGAKPASISIRPVPPVEEIIPTIIEPLPPPPATVALNQNQNEMEPEKAEAPQVVVVTPETPDISFAVPTIGNLIAPSALAEAPPLRPLAAPAALRNVPSNLDSTGASGERPQPPYPRIALEQGEQGSVTLLLTADETGNIISAEVKESSGFPVLDRGTLDYVKRHWTVPPGPTNRLFQATITYRLQ